MQKNTLIAYAGEGILLHNKYIYIYNINNIQYIDERLIRIGKRFDERITNIMAVDVGRGGTERVLL